MTRGIRNPRPKLSSLTLPPHIEQRLVDVVYGDENSVLALRNALLETFYPAINDRCPMCGGSGLYRSMVGKRVIEEGCDECDGTGRTKRGTITARFGAALEILCGRRVGPDDETAKLSASEFAAGVLDGTILKEVDSAESK